MLLTPEKLARLIDISAVRAQHGEREILEAKVSTLQAELRSRGQDVVALQAAQDRLQEEVQRLRSEREEVRSRVEGLLEEIGRLETVVQGVGS